MLSRKPCPSLQSSFWELSACCGGGCAWRPRLADRRLDRRQLLSTKQLQPPRGPSSHTAPPEPPSPRFRPLPTCPTKYRHATGKDAAAILDEASLMASFINWQHRPPLVAAIAREALRDFQTAPMPPNSNGTLSSPWPTWGESKEARKKHGGMVKKYPGPLGQPTSSATCCPARTSRQCHGLVSHSCPCGRGESVSRIAASIYCRNP